MTQLKSSTLKPASRADLLDCSCDEQRLDFSFRKPEFRFKDLGRVFGQLGRRPFDLDRVVRELRKSRWRIDLAVRIYPHRREKSALAVLHILGDVFHVHNRRRKKTKPPRALRQLSLGLRSRQRLEPVDERLQIRWRRFSRRQVADESRPANLADYAIHVFLVSSPFRKPLRHLPEYGAEADRDQHESIGTFIDARDLHARDLHRTLRPFAFGIARPWDDGLAE